MACILSSTNHRPVDFASTSLIIDDFARCRSSSVVQTAGFVELRSEPPFDHQRCQSQLDRWVKYQARKKPSTYPGRLWLVAWWHAATLRIRPTNGDHFASLHQLHATVASTIDEYFLRILVIRTLSPRKYLEHHAVVTTWM